MEQHEFKNTHTDRDCVDCGKPLSDPIHKEVTGNAVQRGAVAAREAPPIQAGTAEPKAEPERKKLF